ncbi:non-homologous end-joining DNA ligase [Streptomyces carpaticus]|uniref:non-homologous end-joining DNA ligase n=1 Tax=Streptomyces carpaticus TaxID=285558 RepID=UPI0021F95626|nr:non-homologous end-joining DNA ligase [Streptomyces carpaticus]
MREEEVPEWVPPMLAVEGEPPVGDRWGYEFKWDGYRCCLRIGAGGGVRATSRAGNDFTGRYPELAEIGAGPVVLDGEIVALDAAGRPDFGLLQRRAQPPFTPVVFFAFDVLWHGGRSLLAEPYRERRAVLDSLAGVAPERLAVPPYVPGSAADPGELLEVARANGLEGLVAKRLDAPYRPGRRSALWVKKPLVRTQEVLVGGWQPGAGQRGGTIGSLLVGAYGAGGGLRYLGRVGSGFTRGMLAELLELLEPRSRARPPFADAVPAAHARRAHWVDPALVGEVAYRAWTRDGRLRQPSWRGLRPDKAPGEVRVEGPPLTP